MRNWKTTLIGFLAAFWLVAQPIITNGDFDIQRDWKTLVFAAIATFFGLFAKDKDVSGISKSVEATDNSLEDIGLPMPKKK